jgi:hypothetical protein
LPNGAKKDAQREEYEGSQLGKTADKETAVKFNFVLFFGVFGECGSVVVKALFYKPEGRRFEIRLSELTCSQIT